MKELAVDHKLKSSGLVMTHSDNYNRWQYDIVLPYIGKNILEVGCGLGNLTQFLISDATRKVQSIDLKPEAIVYIKQRFKDIPKFHAENVDLMNYPAVSDLFDTIFFFNVLEHIEDDLAALQKCVSLTKKGGVILLLVPAHEWLFGTCDSEAGHVRRYTQTRIKSLAQSLDLTIEGLKLFNSVGALGWYVNYCLLKRKHTNNSESDFQVDFFDRYLVKPTRFLESFLKVPFGISYIAVLRTK